MNRLIKLFSGLATVFALVLFVGGTAMAVDSDTDDVTFNVDDVELLALSGGASCTSTFNFGPADWTPGDFLSSLKEVSTCQLRYSTNMENSKIYVEVTDGPDEFAQTNKPVRKSEAYLTMYYGASGGGDTPAAADLHDNNFDTNDVNYGLQVLVAGAAAGNNPAPGSPHSLGYSVVVEELDWTASLDNELNNDDIRLVYAAKADVRDGGFSGDIAEVTYTITDGTTGAGP